MYADIGPKEGHETKDGLIRIRRSNGEIQYVSPQELDELNFQRKCRDQKNAPRETKEPTALGLGIWASVTCLFLVLLIGVVQV